MTDTAELAAARKLIADNEKNCILAIEEKLLELKPLVENLTGPSPQTVAMQFAGRIQSSILSILSFDLENVKNQYGMIDPEITPTT